MTDQFQRIDLPAASAADRAVQRVAEATHRLNEAVQRAVSAGVSVEIVRVSRHHDGSGNWGDQVVPTIRQTGGAGGDGQA
ncbi:hypothetical protein [Paracoccus jiaweipingae]|uniref:hypothetical protein n=1 Tax=unclassified Paracoccus (in: a-proteobacteria) TaxID=2688777 RepID=UPI0037A027C6